MPTYQYACTACDERLEVVQKFSDEPLTVCPACEGRLRKVFSPVGVVFKGSGFYRTDSRKETASAGAKSGAGSSDGSPSSSSSSKESAGSASGGDSKAATSDGGASGGKTDGGGGKQKSAESKVA